jgi:hypothetical protein
MDGQAAPPASTRSTSRPQASQRNTIRLRTPSAVNVRRVRCQRIGRLQPGHPGAPAEASGAELIMVMELAWRSAPPAGCQTDT